MYDEIMSLDGKMSAKSALNQQQNKKIRLNTSVSKLQLTDGLTGRMRSSYIYHVIDTC